MTVLRAPLRGEIIGTVRGWMREVSLMSIVYLWNAQAMKLHVNVEGGFGPTWELQHRECVEMFMRTIDHDHFGQVAIRTMSR